MKVIIVDKKRKIHEQITEERWCNNKWFDVDKGACCLVGWLGLRYSDTNGVDRIDQNRQLLNILGIQNGSVGSALKLIEWNDDPSRKFTEVKDLLVKADL